MRLRNPLFASFVILLFACPLLAQPLANRLPTDTLVYAGWRGASVWRHSDSASRT